MALRLLTLDQRCHRRSRRNDEARAAKQRQIQQDSRDRRARQEANNVLSRSSRDQERRNRETLLLTT
jgi:hypothetical protein